MTTQAEWEASKRTFLDALLGIVAVFIGATATALVVFSSIVLFNMTTAGPADDARASLSQACQEEFKANVYNAACVSFVEESGR